MTQPWTDREIADRRWFIEVIVLALCLVAMIAGLAVGTWLLVHGVTFGWALFVPGLGFGAVALIIGAGLEEDQ